MFNMKLIYVSKKNVYYSCHSSIPGGPQFEVLLDANSNPPVVMQQSWKEPLKSTNLPYLPRQPASASPSKQYSTLVYGRNNGYIAHNKTVPVDDMVLTFLFFSIFPNVLVLGNFDFLKQIRFFFKFLSQISYKILLKIF